MDKKSYAFGMSLAGNLLQSGVHGLNFDDFVAGLKAMILAECELERQAVLVDV